MVKIESWIWAQEGVRLSFFCDIYHKFRFYDKQTNFYLKSTHNEKKRRQTLKMKIIYFR